MNLELYLKFEDLTASLAVKGLNNVEYVAAFFVIDVGK